MKQTELRKMLDDHKEWLENETRGKRLDLGYFDLRYVDLSKADLRYADLYKADLLNVCLAYANLNRAILFSANLENVDLSKADLSKTDLRYAILFSADLRDADLRDADLRDADLRDADLRDADLRGANLRYADLRDADLRGASLFSANLEDANLKDIKVDEDTLYYHLRCPEEGSYIGFKKCAGKLIVKLEIPADAYRSSATTNKCRASKAKVLEISDIERKHFFGEARSSYDSEFVYRVGEVIEVPDFNNNRWVECTNGIHHFMTREEAIVY